MLNYSILLAYFIIQASSRPVSLLPNNIHVIPPSLQGPGFIPPVGSSYWSFPPGRGRYGKGSPSMLRHGSSPVTYILKGWQTTKIKLGRVISLFLFWVNCLSEWRKMNFWFLLYLYLDFYYTKPLRTLIKFLDFSKFEACLLAVL